MQRIRFVLYFYINDGPNDAALEEFLLRVGQLELLRAASHAIDEFCDRKLSHVEQKRV